MLSKRAIRSVRGQDIAMVFQDPMSALNPLMKVGHQVSEMMAVHKQFGSAADRRKRVIELFKRVRIPDAEKRYDAYPHELSGGMRQRVMIAMALSNNPKILIADEPTTALDVTIQQQILNIFRSLQSERKMGIIFITHDLGVVAELCTRAIVMYGGQIMEQAPVSELFARPAHPYTIGLMGSLPGLATPETEALDSIPGSPPDMLAPPAGCPFAPRCRNARNICAREPAPWITVNETHFSRCWLLDSDAPDVDNPFAARKESRHG